MNKSRTKKPNTKNSSRIALAQQEHELFEWLLTQRLLFAAGQLETYKVARLLRIPGVDLLDELTDREVAQAMASKDPVLNDAMVAYWNAKGLSAQPMTFEEIYAKFECDTTGTS